MQNTLDNLVGTTVAPLVAVFVPRVAPSEYGGPDADDFNRFLIEELLPHLDRHYLTDGKRRAIMGPGSAGVSAVLRRPLPSRDLPAGGGTELLPRRAD